MNREDLELRIRAIDSRVKNLEKVNDSYMASKGEVNNGILDLINNLMDQRDTFASQLMQM